jgi:multisubunit Na+/H+ antiporter MnhB subunit
VKLISDIFGIIGILLTVILYQQKNRKSLLVYKLIIDVVWIGHYAFIGAYSGAVVCVIAALREFIFVKRDPRSKKGIVWLPIFILVAIISTVFTWNNAFSILTCLASCIAVVSFFIGKPKLSRIFVFPISTCMLVYDIACGSVAGIVNECFAMSSSAVGIILHDRKHKDQ